MTQNLAQTPTQTPTPTPTPSMTLDETADAQPETTGRTSPGEAALPQERADLLAELATARRWLRHTVRDLTDDQARLTPTVSELCLGGLIKHVSDVERSWARFTVEGPSTFPSWNDPDVGRRRALSFQLAGGETLEGVLEAYAEVAQNTDDLVISLPDLNADQPLPTAPWFPPGATWTARKVLLHVISETSQHAGHADVIREAIDGAKSMG